MTRRVQLIRALLFMPAASRKLVDKAATLPVDAIVLDLEDATPPAEKAAARAGLVAAFERLRDAPARRFVRVNGPLTPWFHADLLALRELPDAGIVIPKVESARDLEVARSLAGPASTEARTLIAGIETLAGVEELAHTVTRGTPDGIYFGAEDLAADYGFGPSEASDLAVARAGAATTARRFGMLAIDRAVVNVRDEDAFVADAKQGRALGYTGKICLTPGQAQAAQAVFRPAPADIDWARAVLRAYAQAIQEGSGVTMVGTEFVDEAIARRARMVLQLAGEMPAAKDER